MPTLGTQCISSVRYNSYLVYGAAHNLFIPWLYRNKLCTLCFPQNAQNLNDNKLKTVVKSLLFFRAPHNDSQQPMTTAFLHIRKYTWHRAPTSNMLSCRTPVEQGGDHGSQNKSPVLIRIRWFSVTWGVPPKAKSHRGSAALYNVTLALANAGAISLAACKRAWGNGGWEQVSQRRLTRWWRWRSGRILWNTIGKTSHFDENVMMRWALNNRHLPSSLSAWIE